MLSQCNKAVGHANSEQALLEGVCRVLVEQGGYRLAWVGFPEQDAAKTIRIAAAEGPPTAALLELRPTWSDEPTGRGVAGRAVRSGAVALSRGIHEDPGYRLWRETALRHGCLSALGLPLKPDGRVEGVLCIYAAERDAFDSEESALMEELAQELSVGLRGLRAREALRKSEARLVRAQRMASLGSWERDLISGEIDWSDEMYRIYGRNRQEFRPSMEALAACVHPEDRERVEWAGPGRGEGSGLDGLDHRILHPDGQVRHVREHVEIVRDESGRAVRLIGTVQDVTEYKRLEEQLLQAQKLESIGRLAGGVAHDFNNLLTVINGYSDLALRETPHFDPLRRHLEQIHRAGERAAALTRQLLAFSRRQVFQPVVLDLNHLVVNAEKMLRRLIGEDVDLVVTLEPALGRVKADAGQLEQVLLNLAVNARDAMPQGGELTIETANAELKDTSAGREAPPGWYVRLTVSDTGVGMDEQTKSHIFEPFFTTKPHGEGTGLGLSTVYGIVKQSGGWISVHSEPEKGSTFRIYLPRVGEAVSAAEPQQTAPALCKQGQTILLVEDQKEVMDFAVNVLAAQGYRVLAAANPDEAIWVAGRHPGPIHLLVTDVVMPVMTGRQLALRLRQVRPKMRVLYISGYPENVITHHGVLEPGVAFLQKPFNAEDLTQAVMRVLEEQGRVRRVLVVGPSASTRGEFRDILGGAGFEVVEAGGRVECLSRLAETGAGLVVTDLEIPAVEAHDLVRVLREQHPQVPILAASTTLGESSLKVAESLGVVAVEANPVRKHALLDGAERLMGA